MVRVDAGFDQPTMMLVLDRCHQAPRPAALPALIRQHRVHAPLARAVVGGLTTSTLITPVLVPVVYSLFHRERTIVGQGARDNVTAQ